jgi:hypothetical protein
VAVERAGDVDAQPDALGRDGRRAEVRPGVEHPARVVADEESVEAECLGQAAGRQQVPRRVGRRVVGDGLEREADAPLVLLDPGTPDQVGVMRSS